MAVVLDSLEVSFYSEGFTVFSFQLQLLFENFLHIYLSIYETISSTVFLHCNHIYHEAFHPPIKIHTTTLCCTGASVIENSDGFNASVSNICSFTASCFSLLVLSSIESDTFSSSEFLLT